MDKFKKIIIIPIVIIIISLYLIGANLINRIDRVENIRDKAFEYESSADVEDENQNKVNINTATEKELIEVNGIGKTLAKRIVEYREKIGEFVAVDELMDIEGIGISAFEKIMPYVTVE